MSRSKSTLLDPPGHVAPLLGIRNDNDGCLVVVGGVGGVGGRCAGDGAIPTMGSVRYYDIELISPPYFSNDFFGGDDGNRTSQCGTTSWSMSAASSSTPPKLACILEGRNNPLSSMTGRPCSVVLPSTSAAALQNQHTSLHRDLLFPGVDCRASYAHSDADAPPLPPLEIVERRMSHGSPHAVTLGS